MPGLSGPLAGAGSPRRREEELPFVRRVGSWLVWWALLMAFWLLVDDSIALAELLAGAGAAALGAFLAELVQYQAATHFRMRIEWTVPALRLPVQVVRDTVTVFTALWRRLVHGEEPNSGFSEVPKAFGDDSPEGVTRRALLVAGISLAPNTLALGIDSDRDVMVVHRLVQGGQGGQGGQGDLADGGGVR
ncbi:MAG: Na+/H+ antiporter subunit E [Acidimicrobiales bacterium]